nr:MAG TPA: hypothetical protein [Caudoviricetes sp.]
MGGHLILWLICTLTNLLTLIVAQSYSTFKLPYVVFLEHITSFLTLYIDK